MSAFYYQAIAADGTEQKGIIQADSVRHARQLLRGNALIPTQISLSNKNQRRKKTRQKKLSSAELSLLTRQLATLLTAGIPLDESIKGVYSQHKKPLIRETLMVIHSKILEGYSLAQAMNEFPGSFPKIYRATINAGEQTGNLDGVLEKLADYVEKRQEINIKVKQSLIYPSLMISVSLGILLFLLTYVIPKIIEVFNDSNQTLPFITILLVKTSDLIRQQGLFILLLLILFFCLSKLSLRQNAIQLRWHHILLKLPIISYLIKTSTISRYVHTFSILFAAGVSVLEALDAATSLVNNLVLLRQFNTVTVNVREGMAVSDALEQADFFPPMSLHLIKSGEKSGSLALMMDKAAMYLDNELKRFISTLLTLLEPIIILLMGALVLFIVLATLLPIFSMEQWVN